MSAEDSQTFKAAVKRIENDDGPVEVTVRQLLTWFGLDQRNSETIPEIRERLASHGLETWPDFEDSHVNGSIIIRSSSTTQRSQDSTSTSENPEHNASLTTKPRPPSDNIPKIAKLQAASKPPVSVDPNAKISEVKTKMLVNNYSQLPVMQGERDVKGHLTWPGIASRELNNKEPCEEARHCMESDTPEIPIDEGLVNAVRKIAKTNFVLIRGPRQKISGIVTTSDIASEFQNFAAPFLLIGKIENLIRSLIRKNLTIEAIDIRRSDTDNNQQVTDVHDLTFGEYIRILEDPKYWDRLEIDLDRAAFVGPLDKVRRIRNRVMHFKPDPINEKDFRMLKQFSNFLQQL